MINTLYVANRGEIARRIARTCERLEVECVVADGVDYLDGAALLAQAREWGADAVHPGYGFLSENAGFARAVGEAGLVWVGPPPEVIDQMGRKDVARDIAVAAGVPVVPSYLAELLVSGAKPNENARYDEHVDYPVLVKAASGGGGKGMRIVRGADEMDDAVAAAKREAKAAFGDDTVLVERYVERGRHIEVQVLGDVHGQVVHLRERDCSPQRRHQKVLEEAPAPTLDDALRERILDAGVALARHVGYVNAGTVEFLLDAETGEFYFLEMNTRLQVEHPVTEQVVRVGGEPVDLVELQLRVAAGRPLPFAQHDVTVVGHAIEARVYAEDAYAGFLPQAGRASVVRWPGLDTPVARSSRRATRPPDSGAFVRVDHDLESGQAVSTAFDPMLGKVIAHGSDREAARQELVAALDDTAILGLTTNTGYLRQLVAGESFRDAAIDTAWLDRHQPPVPDPAPARELAAWSWLGRYGEHDGPFASDGFRLGAPPAPVVVELDEPVTLVGRPPAELSVARVTGHLVELAHRGQRFVFERPDPAADHAVAGDGSVEAPMPGTVLGVRVEPGRRVAAEETLGVLEAMKMELALKAPFAGTVTEVEVGIGDQVRLGQLLFVVERDVE